MVFSSLTANFRVRTSSETSSQFPTNINFYLCIRKKKSLSVYTATWNVNAKKMAEGDDLSEWLFDFDDANDQGGNGADDMSEAATRKSWQHTRGTHPGVGRENAL